MGAAGGRVSLFGPDQSLRLNHQRCSVTDYSDVLAILSSPHLTRLATLDLGADGNGYGDDGLLTYWGRRVGRTASGPMTDCCRRCGTYAGSLAPDDVDRSRVAGSGGIGPGQHPTHLDLSWMWGSRRMASGG